VSQSHHRNRRTVRQVTPYRPSHPDDVRHEHVVELAHAAFQAERRGRIDLARRLRSGFTQSELDLVSLMGGRCA
jgi:hypothetical protein